MATLLKVLNNLADMKSAGGVALRVRTQAELHFHLRETQPAGANDDESNDMLDMNSDLDGEQSQEAA
jgi:hypothetical protein